MTELEIIEMYTKKIADATIRLNEETDEQNRAWLTKVREGYKQMLSIYLTSKQEGA